MEIGLARTASQAQASGQAGPAASRVSQVWSMEWVGVRLGWAGHSSTRDTCQMAANSLVPKPLWTSQKKRPAWQLPGLRFLGLF